MNRKKTIIAAVVLMLVLLVGGLIAYFTDTDTKTNTFTIGNVKIELQEPTWDSTGQTKAESLMPGTEVEKDPKIKNTGTTGAYMFLQVTEPCYEGAPVFTFGANDEVNSGWVVVGTERACSANTGVSTATTVYAYGNASAMTEVDANATTGTLFDTVILKSTLDEEALTALVGGDFDDPDDVEIVVNAYGIQADNVTGTPAQVFANFS